MTNWDPRLETATVHCSLPVQLATVAANYIVTILYGWFSWVMALLLKGKSRGLCLVQLCAKSRLVSAISSPYN